MEMDDKKTGKHMEKMWNLRDMMAMRVEIESQYVASWMGKASIQYFIFEDKPHVHPSLLLDNNLSVSHRWVNDDRGCEPVGSWYIQGGSAGNGEIWQRWPWNLQENLGNPQGITQKTMRVED